MPTFEIDHGGKTYEVDAPDMATAAASFPGTTAPPGTMLANSPMPSAATPVAPQPSVPPSYGVDMARSVPGGLAKGVAGLSGLPGDATQSFVNTISSLVDKFLPGSKPWVSGGMNLTARAVAPNLPTSAMANTALSGPTGGYYQPQTVPGEYAQTAASFLPAALMPTAAESTLGDVGLRAAHVLLPAIGSETGGQMFKGTPYEPAARTFGGIAGGLAEPTYNAVKAGVSNLIAGSGPTPPAQAAHEAGFDIPPNMASEKPGAVSQVLSGWSGKVKTQQLASVKNAGTATDLATQELGLPSDATLNDKAFSDARQPAYAAYEAVKKAPVSIVPDEDFKATVANLGSTNTEAAQYFPDLIKNKEIDNLVSSLNKPEQFTPRAGVQLVRQLRQDAASNIKAFDDPAKQALGMAQRDAATAVDGLIERNLQAAGMPDLVSKYQQARQFLAKSYDIETATNTGNGNVNPRVLAALSNKGAPLSGNLKSIADAANTFPKAFQNPASFGGHEGLGILDLFGAASSAAAGRPDLAGALLGRPLVRSGILSSAYQNKVFGPPQTVPGMLASINANPAAFLLAIPNAMRPENRLNGPVGRTK